MASVKIHKRRSWLKWVLLFLLTSFLVLWYLMASQDMRHTDHEVNEVFSKLKTSSVVERVSHLSDSIRIIRTGILEADTAILFVHGAPGSSDAFYDYQSDAALVNKVHLISYDRPGYGCSSYGIPVTNILEQAEVIEIIVRHLHVKKLILVSHSYGCAIAGAFTADHPDLVVSNIMLSPVIDPLQEKVFFFSSWPSLPFVEHLFSGAFQVSSHEKMTHADELNKLEAYWKSTQVPTILMHGEKDWIAPVANAHYLNDKVVPRLLTVIIDEDASHFIPWTQKTRVVQKIVEFL